MLNPVGLLAPEPAHDHLEPLAGTHEPIRSRAIARHGTLVTSKIRCTSISQPLSQQDFISPRVNSTVTGAEVGDHVGHPFSWSTLVIATPTFGTLSSLSCGPIVPRPPKTREKSPTRGLPNPGPSTNPGAHHPSTRAAPICNRLPRSDSHPNAPPHAWASQRFQRPNPARRALDPANRASRAKGHARSISPAGGPRHSRPDTPCNVTADRFVNSITPVPGGPATALPMTVPRLR